MSAFPDPLSLAASASVLLGILALALLGLEAGDPGPRTYRRWGLACLAAAFAFAVEAGLGFAASSNGDGAAGWSLLANLLLGATFIALARALAPVCRNGSSLIRLALAANVVHVAAATACYWLAGDPRWHSVASAAVAALAFGAASAIVVTPTRPQSLRFLRTVSALLAATSVFALLRTGLAAVLGPGRDVTGEATLMLLATATVASLPLTAIVHGHRQLLVQLRQSALLDPLTGLVNRRGLAQAWTNLAARAQRGDQAWHIGVVMVDIDDFKGVNQRHGQAQGDLILQIVADTLRQTGRRYDVACRFDSEQFCMLLPGVTIRQAQSVTERIRQRFAALAIERTGIEASLSAGVTVSDAGSATLQQATDVADQMLHAAKHEGQNRSRVDPDAVRVVSGMKPLGQPGHPGTQDQFGFPLV